MSEHYTLEELELYRHKEMSVLGRVQCMAHLRECPECRALLDELENDDEIVKEMRESIKIFNEILVNPAKE